MDGDRMPAVFRVHAQTVSGSHILSETLIPFLINQPRRSAQSFSEIGLICDAMRRIRATSAIEQNLFSGHTFNTEPPPLTLRAAL
jgi:hypothetical protein